MGLAVHPYISGVPHRIGWFEQALDYMAARPARCSGRGGSIMDWYLQPVHELGQMSRAERDAAYNNGEAVKDSAVLHAAREAASQRSRVLIRNISTCGYGPRERNAWDRFPAARIRRAAMPVFIHGGYCSATARSSSPI